MLRKVHRPRGLNLRDSDINRNPEFAQDLRNVEKNSKGELILRWGYEKVLDDPGIIDLFEYVGASDDPNRGALLALKSDGLYRLEGSALVKINESNVAGQPAWTEQTKTVEYNKVLYWNDPSFVADLWKFDGFTTHRAGVPKPGIASITSAGTAGDYFFRIILKYYDPRGNITYSDFEQFKSTGDEVDITFLPITDSYYDGFYQKFSISPAGAPQQLVDSANLTLNLDPASAGGASHNYVAGDYMTLIDVSGAELLDRNPILIDSVTADTITFNAASVGTRTLVANLSGDVPLEIRYEIEVYRSEFEFSNYEKMGTSFGGHGVEFFLSHANSNTLTNWLNGGSLNTFSNPLGTPLEASYDDTLIRVLPPKGKYIALYNEHMVVGNLGKTQPDFGFASILGNDTRLEDSIVWSDIPTLSNGSSVETFLVNNIRSVGNSEDGAIAGMHGNDDSFAVHKEKQSFYVNGDFITNTLRVRRAMTEQVGTASHRSIKTVEGGHLYTSPKGVFLAIGGNKPTELSDMIEPLFTDNALDLGTLELKKAKSVNDFLREKIYIYVPVSGQSTGVLLTYDYYYKEWFLHDNIPADNGFQDVGVDSSEIYFADSTALYKRSLSVKKDVNRRIDGRYLTGWFDIDAPSIKKKFTNLVLLSVNPLEWVVTLKGFCNWNKDNVEGQGDLSFSSTINVDDYAILSVDANSVAYEFSNETSGDDMLITGYEVQFAETQQSPKGDT